MCNLFLFIVNYRRKFGKWRKNNYLCKILNMNQLDLITDYLQQPDAQPVRILVRGNSMRPYLVHERDYVVVTRISQVQSGDVVLALLSSGKYVMHRVEKVAADGVLILRGDGNLTTEQCPVSAVCGVAIGFYRKGSKQLTPVSAISYRLYRWCWMHTLPLRRYCLALHHLCFGSCKDLSLS